MSQQQTIHILHTSLLSSIRRGLASGLTILALLPISIVNAQVRERAPEEAHWIRDESSSRHFREVGERIRETGSRPVIIRLRAGNGTESIRQSQQALLDELAGYDATSIKQFKNVPYLGIRVNEGGLDRLRASSLVLDIQEDNAVHPSLVAREKSVVAEGPGVYTGAGQTIAVVGAGFDRTQPELAGRLVGEGCYSTGDANQGISPLCAIGERGQGYTACQLPGAQCQTTIAQGRSGAGILALQVFSRIDGAENCPNGGSCLVAFDSDVVLALERVYEWRRDHRIAAVSLEVSNLRLMENCDNPHSAMKDVLALLTASGIGTIVAGENGGTRACGAITPGQFAGFTGGGLELAGLFAAVREAAPSASLGEVVGTISGAIAARGEGDLDARLSRLASDRGVAGSGSTEVIDLVAEAGSVARPVAPNSLLASALSTSQVELTWTDNSSNEAGFSIRRKKSTDGDWVVIATIAPNTTTFRDVDLFPGTTYLYTVSAINTAGESPLSNEVSVSLPIYNFILYNNNGRTISNSAHPNRHHYYRISVPYGATQLLVQTSGTGNADLYVRYGGQPNLNLFDCRSILDTSADRCVFSYPRAGDWYIMVYGNSRSVINYNVSATYLTGIENNLPTAPSNLTVIATSATQINLSWNDNSTNETGFSIRRKTGRDGTWTQIATVSQNVTTFFNTGLDPDLTYYYAIVAYNLAGVSASSNEANATTPGALTARPIAPGSLQAISSSGPVINLQWVDNSTNEAGFSIRRRNDQSNVWSVIASVGPNVTSYQDTRVSPGTTYFYTVSAINTAGESPVSNEAGATTFGGADNLTSAPVNLQAMAASTVQVDLEWKDSSTSESGFRIRRKEGIDGPWILIAIVNENVSSYQDIGVTPGISYSYTVTAFNGTGESAASNEVSVLMPLFDFTPLANGVMIPHTVGRYRIRYYRINVPIGASELLVQTKGIGSTAMYVRYGSQPNNFFYNCRSLSDTTNNRCYFQDPEPGDWHIMLTSTTQLGSNYQLTGTYKMGANLNILTPTGK